MATSFQNKCDETLLKVEELMDGQIDIHMTRDVDEMTVDSFDLWYQADKEERPALALAILGNDEHMTTIPFDSPDKIADYVWSDDTLLQAARIYLRHTLFAKNVKLLRSRGYLTMLVCIA